MKKMSQEFKTPHMDNLDNLLECGRIDAEFIPYIKKINESPYCLTVGCCTGHVRYWSLPTPPPPPRLSDYSPVMVEEHPVTRFKRDERPPNATDCWGYLQVFVSPVLGLYLVDECVPNWDWIWTRGSSICSPGDGMKFEVVGDQYAQLAFAWDASHWPRPAIDLQEAICGITAERLEGYADDMSCLSVLYRRDSENYQRWLSVPANQRALAREIRKVNRLREGCCA